MLWLVGVALAGPVEDWLARLDDRACAEQLLLTYPPVHGNGPLTQGGVLVLPPAVGDASAAAHRERLTALQARSEVPLLIAADMEGGRFSPFREHPVLGHLPSARTMGGLPEEEVEALGRETARALREMGVHVDLAPVIDVSDGTGHIGRFWRAFSDEPQVVVERGGAFARGLAEGGVIAVGKHYPGYGGTQKSSDHQRVEAEGPGHPEVFTSIDAALPAVMMSPLLYDGVPAVLTAAWVQDAHEQGWVVWTDDLYAARSYLGPHVLSEAFLAGNDVLVVNAPYDWGELPAMREDLLRVATRPEHRSRLREACARVLGMKRDAGLLPPG